MGEFEQIVLLAVHRLAEGAYGVSVRQEITARVGRQVSIGAVYATVNRLTDKGYLESYGTDPVPIRGGRARRHFRLTPAGAGALRTTRDMLGAMWEGVDVESDPSAI